MGQTSGIVTIIEGIEVMEMTIRDLEGARTKVMRGMMKLFLLITVFAISVLNVAMAANAESSWLLWRSFDDDGVLHWKTDDAFLTSHDKCKAVQYARCESQKNEWKSSSRIKHVADNLSGQRCCFFKNSFRDHSSSFEGLLSLSAKRRCSEKIGRRSHKKKRLLLIALFIGETIS